MVQRSIVYDKDYKLSVLFSRDSCRYMISKGDEIVDLDSIYYSLNSFNTDYKEQLENVFIPLLNSDIQVSIAVLNSKFIFIDSKYVKAKNKGLLLSTVSTLYPTDQIFENKLIGDSLSQLFVLPSQVDEIISSVFSDLIPRHVAYTLDGFYKTNVLMPGFTMFVCFFENSFLIHLYEEGSLVLANLYNFKSDSDLLYYVTRLYSLIVKEDDSFYIHLSGLHEEDLDRMVDLLSRYYQNAAKISYSLTHSIFSDNKNIDLHSIAICE